MNFEEYMYVLDKKKKSSDANYSDKGVIEGLISSNLIHYTLMAVIGVTSASTYDGLGNLIIFSIFCCAICPFLVLFFIEYSSYTIKEVFAALGEYVESRIS